MKLANVTLVRENTASAIISQQYQETVPCWKITWSPNHVIFHTNTSDENDMIIYRSDRVYEITTEDYS